MKNLQLNNKTPYILAGINSTTATKVTTRKQVKHDMLVTFMANANTKPAKRRNTAKPTILKTLLSFFL